MRDERIILNLTRGNVLCEQVEIADSALPRMRGLLGRRSLPVGTGHPASAGAVDPHGVHALRVRRVFLDGQPARDRIVSGAAMACGVARHAASVLELAAGEIFPAGRGARRSDRRRRQRPGDRRQLDACVSAQDAPVTRTAPGLRRLEGARADRADARGCCWSASDRRFRSVAAALLQRRGCIVSRRRADREHGRGSRRASASMWSCSTPARYRRSRRWRRPGWRR